MADNRSFVIVGASLAGAKAAETLRSDGFDGRVVLVGEEPFRPYERPPLSKGLLRGESPEETVFVHPPGFYADNDIELRLSTEVESVDRAGRQVGLGTGERIGYDALLLATGAYPRRIGTPGADLPGVHYLRRLDDSIGLREAIRSSRSVVVIGGGFIGCEVAASARQMGAPVAVVEPAEVPFERALGRDMGSFYKEVHSDHGVDFHTGAGVSELAGTQSVEAAVLTDGTRLEADLVVVGVGVSPRVELAQAAGLDLDNGVLTDEYLVTSDPAVFAVGDVANAWHPLLRRRVRLEHWSAALNQGPVAAHNMIERRMSYTKIPYFYSDQYDVSMEYTGLADPGDDLVVRGDTASREFIAFWVRDGRVTAGMNVNIFGVTELIAALVASGATVDPVSLADPEFDLAVFEKTLE